jgi:hypothetical protein
MNRLLVVFAAMALSVAACSDNNNNGNDGGTTTDGGVTTDAGNNDGGVTNDGGTDAGTNDGGVTDGGTTDGGTADGTATISGTIPGSTNFTPTSAISTTDPADTSTGVVLISDIANACSLAQSNTEPKNAQALSLELNNQVAGQGAALTTGTYNVTTDTTTPDGLSAQATFITSDATCNITPTALATGGTVTITTLDATNAEGTFSLEFPNAGTTTTTVTGTFTAPICDISGQPTTGTCQP